MKVCLDLHDFSITDNRLDLLLKLKKRWPNLKVSLFTVPIYKPRDDRKEVLRMIKKNLNWIQIIPHGLRHNRKEILYCQDFKNIMRQINEVFAKDGLPYERGFAAPHWRWNKHVVETLDNMDWWGAIDRRQPKMLSPKRFYKYSHCLDEPLTGEVLKLHGHIYGTKNDLGKCFNNLMKLPDKIDWHFVTDFIDETL